MPNPSDLHYFLLFFTTGKSNILARGQIQPTKLCCLTRGSPKGAKNLGTGPTTEIWDLVEFESVARDKGPYSVPAASCLMSGVAPISMARAPLMVAVAGKPWGSAPHLVHRGVSCTAGRSEQGAPSLAASVLGDTGNSSRG